MLVTKIKHYSNIVPHSSCTSRRASSDVTVVFVREI